MMYMAKKHIIDPIYIDSEPLITLGNLQRSFLSILLRFSNYDVNGRIIIPSSAYLPGATERSLKYNNFISFPRTGYVHRKQ